MKTLLLFLAFIASYAHAQSQTLNQAIGFFSNNKRDDAKKAFQSVAKQGGKDEAQALLGLTLNEIDNGHFEDALLYFNQFFQKSANPYPYVYALSSRLSAGTTAKAKDAYKTLITGLLNDPKASPALQALAISNLANRLHSENKLSASDDMYNKLNDVRNWSSVGVFENISASGFTKDFGVLAHPEGDYVFKNNIGTNVKWFKIPEARNDRWWDMEYNYDISNSIIYTQTFLQSDADVENIAMLGVSGSFKLWINDVLIGSEQEERNTDADVYSYKVKLQKGYNRILLQLGSSDLKRSNFMLRFADANGSLIKNIVSSAEYKPYTKATSYEAKPLPQFAEQYLEELTATDKGTLLDEIILLYAYLHNDNRMESHKLANKLKTQAPNCTYVATLLSRVYDIDNNNTDLTRMIELIKSNDPESLIGLMYRYEEAINKEEYNEAEKLINRRIELFGKNADTEVKYINVLAKRNDLERMLKRLDTSFLQYPDEPTFVALQYRLNKNVLKEPKKANAILESYLKKNYDENVIETLVEDRMADNKREEGIKLYKQLITDMPYATMRYSKLATKYYDKRDYSSALEWQQKAMDRAPYVGSFHYTKGLMFDAAGKKTEAIASLEDAIRFSPNNYNARKKLQELKGKKNAFDNFKTNDIGEIFKNAPKAADYPNDNSIYLLKDMQEVIYAENGASEERNEYLIKVFNQKGVDDWKEINIPYNSYTQRLIFDKVELLKKDGSKVQAETNENQVVFSSLEIGDAIHISYKIENSFSGKLAEHFWEEFTFNGSYPTLTARYSLIVPNNRKFNYKMYNTSLKPVTTDIADNNKLYVWEATNNARIEQESYMPSYDDIAQRIVVSSIPDWSYVANWYSDLSNVKVKAEFEVKEKVKELLAGKEKLPAVEKAKIIYNYIEENFTYSNVSFLHSALTPQRASRTLNSRDGDCKDLSVLFVCMAKEAGLDANLILVSTRDLGEKNVDLPTINFNHCIAQLHADGKTYIVELTDKQLPFGAMSNLLVNTNGLYIPKDGQQTSSASLVKLNTKDREGNHIKRTTSLAMNENQAQIQRTTYYTGAETSNWRNRYRDQSEEDKRKKMSKSLGSEFSTAISLKDFSISNLDKLTDTLTLKYGVNIDNYASEIAGMKIIRLPWTDQYSSLDFISLEKRNHPIELWYFSSTPFDKEEMTVVLPKGKKLIEVPANVNISCPSLSYSLTYAMKGENLVVTREVKYLKEFVEPAEYSQFKETITKMAEADKKQLAYK